jgi:oxygen-independent coproporphyrinogen-3 oxidase
MSPLGVYIHWPYCTHICPYCDFNVYRAPSIDSAPLLDAIVADIEAFAARHGQREVSSIFFGGGTPSLLRGADLARIIDATNRALGLASDPEITLEANPEDRALFADQIAAGVNRISIGVQALNDPALKALGRAHDVASALAAVDAASRTGTRVSIDLIYAREGQSEAEWGDELRQALALPVEHLSLYQLTIEPQTAFARRVARGELKPPDNDAAAGLYELTQSLCEEGGFPAYEISNHARNEAARSRHNLLYWRGDDWIGVGPGAHGRFNVGDARIATEAQRRPSDYIDAVREHGVGWVSETPLSDEEAADEFLIMGMRTTEGIDSERIEQKRKTPLNRRALAWLESEGFVINADGRICVTAKGRAMTDKIAAELAS